MDLTWGQIDDPSSWRILFSSVPSSDSLVSVLDPLKGSSRWLCALERPLTSYADSGTAEKQGCVPYSYASQQQPTQASIVWLSKKPHFNNDPWLKKANQNRIVLVTRHNFHDFSREMSSSPGVVPTVNSGQFLIWITSFQNMSNGGNFWSLLFFGHFYSISTQLEMAFFLVFWGDFAWGLNFFTKKILEVFFWAHLHKQKLTHKSKFWKVFIAFGNTYST